MLSSHTFADLLSSDVKIVHMYKTGSICDFLYSENSGCKYLLHAFRNINLSRLHDDME